MFEDINKNQTHPYWIVIFSTSTTTNGSIRDLVSGHAWVGFVDRTTGTSVAPGLNSTIAMDQVLNGVSGPSRIANEIQTGFFVAMAFPVNHTSLLNGLRRVRSQMEIRDPRGPRPKLYHLADWNCATMAADVLEQNVTTPGTVPTINVAMSILNDNTHRLHPNYSPGILGNHLESIVGQYPKALVYHGTGTTDQGTSPNISP